MLKFLFQGFLCSGPDKWEPDEMSLILNKMNDEENCTHISCYWIQHKERMKCTHNTLQLPNACQCLSQCTAIACGLFVLAEARFGQIANLLVAPSFVLLLDLFVICWWYCCDLYRFDCVVGYLFIQLLLLLLFRLDGWDYMWCLGTKPRRHFIAKCLSTHKLRA